MNRKWWKEAVVYQIYPISFYDSNGDGIGDLRGIILKLDYLKEFGIDVIWLSPVYKSPNDDNGYDISDYMDIMEQFGTLSDWEELVTEMHKRGLKIIMDLVVNHTSDEHPWFNESRSSTDNEKRDYYIWTDAKDGKEPNNWGSFFSPSVWEWDEKTGQYYMHIFSTKQPDLNWKNPKVRKEIYDMMKWWLDKGIDGFRMDVVNAFAKMEGFPDAPKGLADKDGHVFYLPYYMNQPGIHEYIKEMNHEVLSKYEIMTVGETTSVTPEEGLLYVGEEREELNMIFQFELMDVDSGAGGKFDVVPYKLSDFKRIMTKWQQGLQGKGWNSLYLNNHDQPRMVSRFGNDGKYRVESAKMLATMLHTLQGTPYIYQGEEIGMTNVKFESIQSYKDIEIFHYYNQTIKEDKSNLKEIMEGIYAKGRDNARTPMQWEDSENAGFTSGTPWIGVNPNYKQINVKESLEDSQSVFNYYKRLIQQRKQNLVIVYGDYVPILEEDEHIYSYLRCFENDRLLVILNFSEKEAIFKLPNEIMYKKKELLISNYETDIGDDLLNLKLKPYEANVYRLI